MTIVTTTTISTARLVAAVKIAIASLTRSATTMITSPERSYLDTIRRRMSLAR